MRRSGGAAGGSARVRVLVPVAAGGFFTLICVTPLAQTPVLTVNLQSLEVQRMDERPVGDAMDAALDQALGAALGSRSSGFSTYELDPIHRQIADHLRKERPRAPARSLVFLSRGSVTAERLKTLSELDLDLELVIDPCDRTVCRDAVGRHIELVGRAVGDREQTLGRTKVQFRKLRIRTVTPMHDSEIDEVDVPMADCIVASQKRSGGVAWLDRLQRAVSRYAPTVSKSIAQEAQRRRVALPSPPRVVRSRDTVLVSLVVRSDRNRSEQTLLAALAATGLALRKNPATPTNSEVQVEMTPDVRGQKPRRYRVPGASIAQYLDGQIGGTSLLRTYVSEVRSDVAQISFDDSDDAP